MEVVQTRNPAVVWHCWQGRPYRLYLVSERKRFSRDDYCSTHAMLNAAIERYYRIRVADANCFGTVLLAHCAVSSRRTREWWCKQQLYVENCGQTAADSDINTMAVYRNSSPYPTHYADICSAMHVQHDMYRGALGQLCNKTGNLSKGHVTRDSSGPATWAIVYDNMQ